MYRISIVNNILQVLSLYRREIAFSTRGRECPLLYTDADILHLLSLLHTEQSVSSLHNGETVPVLYVEAADSSMHMGGSTLYTVKR